MRNTNTAPTLIPSSSSNLRLVHNVYVHHVVVSPCAACKCLRRKCGEKCVLAPYFPPSDPLKFTTAHRVFGASNIVKFLQELLEDQRDDAVTSMVYEANARLRDPVYGCAGAISHLQKEVNELQVQLAGAQAEVATCRPFIYSFSILGSTKNKLRSSNISNICRKHWFLPLPDNSKYHYGKTMIKSKSRTINNVA